MKILQIHNKYQFAGGEDVAVSTEKKMLVSQGHQVYSIESSNSKLMNIYSDRINVYKEINTLIDNEKIDVAHIHNVYHVLGNHVYELLAKKNIPIVQTLHNFRFLCPAGLFLDRKSEKCEHCKCGDFHHSVLKKCYRDSYLQSLAMMKLSSRGRESTLKNVDRFIALNQFYKTKYIEGGFNEDKISIKPYVMFNENTKFEQTTGEYALYLGRISKEKGVEILLSAFAELGKNLVIAGIGEKNYYHDLVERFSQFKNIEFKGFVKGDDKIKILSNAQFIVVPSIWFENSPLTIYESYSLMKPVIASNIGGLPAIVKDGETGFLFEPNNIESLKNAILKIAKNDRFIEMGKSAHEYFQNNFTEKQNYRQLIDIYKKAIATKKLKNEKQKLITLNLSLGSFQDFVNKIVTLGKNRQSAYVCVANVHMCVETHNDDTFAQIVNQADIVTPDGVPLIKGLELLYNINQERVAGPDLMPALLSESEKQGLKVYFYGSTEDVLEKLRKFCLKNYPNLSIAGMHSPPFRVLTEAETQSEIQNINDTQANIVLVALGCPKQERWMANMKGKINSVMVGVGGAFPMLTGVQKRAPLWMQKNSLEWFYRLVQEPRRLFKRYFITNSLFILLVVREKMKVLLGLVYRKISLFIF